MAHHHPQATHPDSPHGAQSTRRGFFSRATDGIHGAALAYLLSRDWYGGSMLSAAEHGAPGPRVFDLLPKQPHFEPRAKAVIHLCMQGGPSQVDLFDPKPELHKHAGEEIPESFTKGSIQLRTAKLLDTPFKFSRHGASGAAVSNLLPHLAKEVDSLAIIRSMYNVHPNHEPAIYKMQSGQTFPGHPVFGSWITYGLGSENQDLPAYVVLADPLARLPTNGVENWQSGYLPPLYQGTPMRPTGSPVLNLRPSFKEPDAVTHAKRDLLARLDRIHKAGRANYAQLDARINNYQLAARMQLEAAEALDTTRESKETLAMYGVGEKETDNYGRRCLLARRLVERGVRFVQLYTKGQVWDNHSKIRTSLPAACLATDKPVAGLLQDLRRRGLLDSTLVLWGGEFGRLPMAQGNMNAASVGRDHGPYGFSCWMAGAGVKPGTVYGATDEFGFAAVENRVSIQDWHATILHQLGMHHEELVYDRNGLKEKLTHVFDARVVKEVLA